MNALGFASDATIRAVLIALCSDKDIQEKALGYLTKLEPLALSAAKAFPNVKRKAVSGLSICVQCEEAFDEVDNTTKDCQYHSGECLSPFSVPHQCKLSVHANWF